MSQAFQLWPALDAATEAALKASIERFGVLVPVVRDQSGNVLDGHHRARIAAELGVKYRVDVVTVADDDEAREIARTLNADRRQLDAEQRRVVVAALRKQGHSERAIAGAVGASPATVHRDIASSEAIAPERVLRQGGGTYPARRPTIIAAKNPQEAERGQEALAVLGDAAPSGRVLDVKRTERIAREHRSEQRRAEQIAKATVHGEVVIKHGDFREVLDLPAASVDAVITDPPYPREFIDVYADLSTFASRVLKPSGSLVVMTGHAHLPEYLAELSTAMSYRWACAYVMPGARARVHTAQVSTGWKPLLVFCRNDADGVPVLVDDVFSSDDDDKRFHHWGQSEAGIAEIVERFTEPGQLVVDPFLGGGTTAVVCRDLGRSFIGCDLDGDAVQTSRERVA